MPVKVCFSLFLVAAMATVLLLAPSFLGESSSQALWPIVGMADLLFLCWLMHIFRIGGSILLVLVFMFSYYLAPVPYFLFRLPIVPYTDNVGYTQYMNTWCVMSAFLGYVVLFSIFINWLTGSKAVGYIDPCNLPKRNWGMLAIFYWLAVLVFILATFKGQPIVNISGADNYGSYMDNLKEQSGSLEYFLVLILLGFQISRTRLDKTCYFLSVAYSLYFTFTRGYRVQMTEMIILVAALHFRRFLTVKKCLALSLLGFLLLQAHGMMKHGVSDPASMFGVLAGNQIQTNQTEVFYTSNNVLNPIFAGSIPVSARAASFALAILASVLPGNLLPATWHSTLSAEGITHLPGGGGGFIAGHYYYWLSAPGVILAAFLVAYLFCLHLRASSRRTQLLTILLMASCPRWVAYEPIAMFFRIGLYFVIADLAVTSFERLLRSLSVQESLA
jgi:hypothetical protein